MVQVQADKVAGFDAPVERRGTHSNKWDKVTAYYDVPPEDNLPMWVADSDFRVPDCVTRALRTMVEHGVHGYGGDMDGYREAIRGWMRTRHGWQIAPDWIFTTTGLVNALAVVLDTFTAPGDAVVLFTPVYHAFARAIRAAGREVTSVPLARDGARYVMDFDAAEAALTGRERVVVHCSPHNPGGRVWLRAEQQALAEFAARHDLLVVSDEIHHDLVFPGHEHVPAARIDGMADRLVVLTAPSKAFNTAGLHTGNVIVPDTDLRARFAARMTALAIAPNTAGIAATAAAYSPEGAEWIDAQMLYLDGNRRAFDDGIAAIPGVASMPLEATYLAWVDFAGTGLSAADLVQRVEREAGIAANRGATFGPGGESFLRFNIATQRANIDAAVARLQKAFADLQ